MRCKTLITACLLTMLTAGCSTVEKVVYRIDVDQGNYLEQKDVAQLRQGMNKDQVLYLLGTPLLNDHLAAIRGTTCSASKKATMHQPSKHWF